MKLLQILYPGIGGHSSVAFYLIEGDSDNKFSHGLLGYGIEDPSVSFIDSANKLSIPIASIKKDKGFEIKSLRRIYTKLKIIKPDVIIMHSTAVILIVWWYCLWHKAKLISVEHQSNSAKSTKDWIYSFLILLFSPKIVYLTENYAQEIKAKFKYIYPKKSIKVIYNGININKFKPIAKSNKSKGNTTFSMISRMTELRDHKTLIDAFCAIAKNKCYQLILAGDGDTKNELELIVKEKGMNHKIFFTGSIDEESIIKLIQDTDIYIHSSLAETLSTSILQVMACKVPIIATDIPGISNLLDDGKDGLLFEPKNVDSLVEKITLLVMDQDLADKICVNAYNKVIKSYSCNKMFQEYKKILIQD